ncbi:MAG: sulfatase [Melioribacteraceae bacterium]
MANFYNIVQRKDIVKVTIFFFLLSVTFLNGQQEQPNIIFIMSDDHAEKAISAYTSELLKTPNIDRIANEGMIFRNSFVTNSICGPSRASMLTGKYSSQNKLRDNRDEFDGTQQTFPKLLQKAGYQTSVIGKWHLKTEPTGFDNYRVLLNQGEYYNPLIWEKGDTNKYIGYTTDLITDFAIDELEKRDKGKPFALLLHHKAPHRNWMPNPKYFGVFDSIDIPIPKTFYDDYKNRIPAAEADMKIDDMYIAFDLKLKKESYEKETGSGGNKQFAKKSEGYWENSYDDLTATQKIAWDSYYDKVNKDFKSQKLSGKELLEWKYKRYMQDYLACILSVDESVGRVLDYLDENNLTENTIVVYTSDQGFFLGEHGWYDKRWMYEESFRTPLVIRYPKKIKPSSESNQFVMNIDYAPTFLEYAGVEIPTDIQGESLKNIFEEKPNDDWRKSMYYHYYEYPHGWHSVRQHYGVRTEKYKLIYFYNMDLWELYDMGNDKNEIHNIYDKMKSCDIVGELKEELEALRVKYKETDI